MYGTFANHVWGVTYLDTDQNPATGFSGAMTNDIGADYKVEFQGGATPLATLFHWNGAWGTGTPLIVTGYLNFIYNFELPLNALGGDDGNMDVVQTLGETGHAYSDIAPDQGHGTIESLLVPHGKIAFVSTRDGHAQIYIMNADGTNQTNLSRNASVETSPAISPDGTKIAYTSVVSGIKQIWIMNADGTGKTPLTSTGADNDYPCWSPNGQIAFVSSRPALHYPAGGGPSVPVNGQDNIWRMNTNGSSPVQATDVPSGTVSNLTWVGPHVEFQIQGATGPAGIYFQFGLNDAGAASVGPPASLLVDSYNNEHPDARSFQIAFSSNRGGASTEIWLANGMAPESDLSQLTHIGGAPANAPAWSPGGNFLAFTVGDNTSSKIKVVDAAGSTVVTLSASANNDFTPSWGLGTVRGSISGYVYDNASPSNPLNGATVEVFTADVFTPANLDHPPVAQTTTDANGYYSLTGLPDGSYKVMAVKTGYAQQFWFNSPFGRTASPISVSSTQGAAGVNFHLTAGGPITGTVSSGGNPVLGLAVRIVDVNNADNWWTPETVVHGLYSINVPNGTYKVYAPYENGPSAALYVQQYFNNQPNSGSANSVIVASAAGVTGVDFNLASVSPAPNLVLTKSAPDTADTNNDMTYTLFYNNLGNSSASAVVLEDTLPAGVTFVSAPLALDMNGSAIAGTAGTYDPGTGKVSWNLGNVAAYPGGSGYRKVTVHVTASAGTPIVNNAQISTTTPETLTGDNTASASTLVTGSGLPAGVTVSGIMGTSGSTPVIYWGDSTTFTYQDAAATSVEIKIHFDQDGSNHTNDLDNFMTGGPPTWTKTYTPFYPRHGNITVTYITTHSGVPAEVVFNIYVDPAGYVYDVVSGNRLSGATVWLQKPDGSGGWVNVPVGASPATMDPDANPLTTDASGGYAWMTLAGTYRTHVTLAGYYAQDSRVVTVPPPVTDLHVGLTPVMSISPGSLPDAWVGIPYSQNIFVISGGVAPYTYSISSGALPAWLSLDATTGVLTGTPPSTGTAVFTIRATDSSGHNQTQNYSLAFNPAPLAITTVSPSYGPTGGGTSITITGAGFVSGATVTIGGAAATGVSVVSATSITATTPAGSLGAKNVVVTTSSGSTTLSGGFTYADLPTITTISPSSGSDAGGTFVTLSGTNFISGATVTIGGAAASGVTVVNAGTITATTPSGTAGARDVVVTTLGGSATLTGGYTYVSSSSSSGGGGGGGGSAPVSNSLLTYGLTANAPLQIDNTGVALNAAAFTTDDGKAVLKVAAGTKLLTKTGAFLPGWVASPVVPPPAAPSGNALVAAYSFEPAGATFYPGITITMSYDPAQLDKNAAEKDLYIAFYDGTQFQSLPCTVDTAAHTVSATITHFSSYALLSKLTAPQPLAFTPTPTPTVTAAPAPTSSATAAPTVVAVPTPTPTAQPKPVQAVTSTQPAVTSTSPAPNGSTPWTMIIVIVVVVLLVLVIAAVVVTKRKSLH